jgi:hypothetical protein
MQATHKDVGRYAYMEVGGRAAPGAGSREQRRSSCRSNYRPTYIRSFCDNLRKGEGNLGLRTSTSTNEAAYNDPDP